MVSPLSRTAKASSTARTHVRTATASASAGVAKGASKGVWVPRIKAKSETTGRELALRDSLGFRATSEAMRRSVQTQKYISPMTGRWVRPTTADVMEADHTFPLERMVKLPGWELLPHSTRKMIVHDEKGLFGNVQGLPSPLNRSKQHRLAAEWTHFQGQPLSKAYRRWLEAEQTRIERTLRKFIAKEVARELGTQARSGAP